MFETESSKKHFFVLCCDSINLLFFHARFISIAALKFFFKFHPKTAEEPLLCFP